jgi:hypothetical protein
MGQQGREASAIIAATYMSGTENYLHGLTDFSKDMLQGDGVKHGRNLGLGKSALITKRNVAIYPWFAVAFGTGVSCRFQKPRNA